jgi:hypothetical protein
MGCPFIMYRYMQMGCLILNSAKMKSAHQFPQLMNVISLSKKYPQR